MRKLLVGICSISLLVSSSVSYAALTTDYAGNSAAATKKASDTSNQTKPKEDAPKPTQVTHKADDDLDYSPTAGNAAANADMALNAVSAAVSALSLIQRTINGVKGAASESWMSWATSQVKRYPTWMMNNWFSIFVSFDWIGLATQLGHAAINKWMRDATHVTASFAGASGHVTDKWVGPPAMNKTTAIMDKVEVTAQSFGALSFDPRNYPGLKDAAHASAYQLMKYRSDQLLEDQRSLKNVTDQNWGLLYRAQQRSIQGLAGALELKKQLADLANVESLISAEYGSKPKALNTVANRRALHDALML